MPWRSFLFSPSCESVQTAKFPAVKERCTDGRHRRDERYKYEACEPARLSHSGLPCDAPGAMDSHFPRSLTPVADCSRFLHLTLRLSQAHPMLYGFADPKNIFVAGE